MCNTRKLNLLAGLYRQKLSTMCHRVAEEVLRVPGISLSCPLRHTLFNPLRRGKFTRGTVIILYFRYFWLRLSLCHPLRLRGFWTPLLYIHFDLIRFKRLMLSFLLDYLCCGWRCPVFNSTCDMADMMRRFFSLGHAITRHCRKSHFTLCLCIRAW